MKVKVLTLLALRRDLNFPNNGLRTSEKRIEVFDFFLTNNS